MLSAAAVETVSLRFCSTQITNHKMGTRFVFWFSSIKMKMTAVYVLYHNLSDVV